MKHSQIQSKKISKLTLSALAALSVLFYCMMFPPTGFWWIGYFGLVPWLILITRVSTKAQIFWSYLIGMLVFLISVHWIAPITIPGYISMCLYLGIYWPLSGFLIRRFLQKKHLLMLIFVPICWIVCEYIRSLGPLGFPWFYLGYSQARIPIMIQIADIGGVYAVSFMLMFVNVAIFSLCESIGTVLGPSRIRVLGYRREFYARGIKQIICASVFVLCVFVYGYWRMGQDTIEKGPKVAVVQEDFPMFVDRQIPGLADTFMAYLSQSINIAETSNPDIVVWPETCIPISINPEFLQAETKDEELLSEQVLGRDVADMLGKYCSESNVMLILGALSKRINAKGHYPAIDRYNSALVYGRDGKYIGRYDKIKLVLFGEYVPFRYTIPRLYWFLNKNMTPYGKDGFEYSLTAGKELKRFYVDVGEKRYRFAIAICYEDTMADLIANFVSPKKGHKQIDFLLNISNDGWFNHSSELLEHLEICRFRAVENRISIARAVNTGISAIITPNGEIQQIVRGVSRLYGPGIRGFAADNLEIDSRTTIYSRIKDFPLVILTLTLLLTLFIDAVRYVLMRKYR